MRTDLGRPLRAATTSENARSSLGRAGDFQPTPIKSTGARDRRGYRSGDQLSLPESTDRSQTVFTTLIQLDADPACLTTQSNICNPSGVLKHDDAQHGAQKLKDVV
jgi:hypothetical protein